MLADRRVLGIFSLKISKDERTRPSKPSCLVPSVRSSKLAARPTFTSKRMVELFFGLLLKPQIADTEVQELEVRESGVDWVLAQPVHLTDEESDEMPFASADGQVREWKISRRGVAQFLALAAQAPEYVGRSVALSGAGVSAA